MPLDVYCDPWSECKIRPSLIVGWDSNAFWNVRIARSLVMLRSVMLATTLRSCKSSNGTVVAYLMIRKEQICEIRAPFSIDFICCEILLQFIIEYFMRVSMLISRLFWADNGTETQLCIHIFMNGGMYCKNNLYVPDRLSYSGSRQLHCAI